MYHFDRKYPQPKYRIKRVHHVLHEVLYVNEANMGQGNNLTFLGMSLTFSQLTGIYDKLYLFVLNHSVMVLAVKDTDRHTDNNQVNCLTKNAKKNKKKFQGKQKKFFTHIDIAVLKLVYNVQ